ncbi:hypothetical protein Tco_1475890 [Tanacetum coccineum]
MNKRLSDADRNLDFKALDSQNIELKENVIALHEQNVCFRAENEKVKQHYKELYYSIKITRAKTIEKTPSLLTKIKKLKTQLKGKMQCVTMNTVKPNVLAHDLEVAFKKHSCYVRDVDGVELLKGSRGSNMYTISLNHLSFSAINDLARKELGPTIPTTSSPPKVVEHEPKVTKDMMPPSNNGSNKDVQPSVIQVQPQVPNSEPVVAPL